MKTFEVVRVGEDLYQIIVDGVARSQFYTSDDIGDLYASLWDESSEVACNE